MSSGCVVLPCHWLAHLRALGPYGAVVGLDLVRRADGRYGVPITFSPGDVVKSTTTSYKTVRKALGILEDLELVALSGARSNQYDAAAGMAFTLTRGSCGRRCGKAVDKAACSIPTGKVGVASQDTAPEPALDAPPQVEGVAVACGATAPSRVPASARISQGLEGVDVERDGKGARGKPDPRIEAVFATWNAQEGLVTHRALTQQMAVQIRRALASMDAAHDGDGELAFMEIAGAVQNFATCLREPQYRWSYSWPLADFLARGLDKFRDEAEPLKRERIPAGSRKAAPTFDASRTSPFEGL